MAVKHITSEGQDLLDVTVQRFGQLDNLFDVLNDNNLNINAAISSGQELDINNENKGDLIVKTNFNNISFVVMNADETALTETLGDYNDDYNNDFS